MTIKSYSGLELELKSKLEMADNLLMHLHRVVTQAPDLTGTELAQTNTDVKNMNDAICECYDKLTDYLVDEEL